MRGIFQHVATTHRALDYHLQRQNVLASNIANVDTPGFRPLELVRADAATPPGTLRLTTTHQGHITGQGGGELRIEADREQVISPGNDANGVSLEREMSKLAANELRYDGAVRIVRSQLALLRYAANDGQ